jgi:hypothetical protein
LVRHISREIQSIGSPALQLSHRKIEEDKTSQLRESASDLKDASSSLQMDHWKNESMSKLETSNQGDNVNEHAFRKYCENLFNVHNSPAKEDSQGGTPPRDWESNGSTGEPKPLFDVRPMPTFQREGDFGDPTSQRFQNASDIEESMDIHVKNLIEKYNMDQGSFNLTDSPRTGLPPADSANLIQIEDQSQTDILDSSYPFDISRNLQGSHALQQLPTATFNALPGLSVIREESSNFDNTQFSISKNRSGLLLDSRVDPKVRYEYPDQMTAPVTEEPEEKESPPPKLPKMMSSGVRNSALSRKSHTSIRSRSYVQTPRSSSKCNYPRNGSNKNIGVLSNFKARDFLAKIRANNPQKPFKSLKLPKFEFKAKRTPFTGFSGSSIFKSSKFLTKKSEREAPKESREATKQQPPLNHEPYHSSLEAEKPMVTDKPLPSTRSKDFVNKIFSKLGVRSPKLSVGGQSTSIRPELKRDSSFSEKGSKWSLLGSSAVQKVTGARFEHFEVKLSNLEESHVQKSTKLSLFGVKDIFGKREKEKEWRPWLLKTNGQKGFYYSFK